MTYRTIMVEDDVGDFTARVNAALAEGWQLQGGVSIAAYYSAPDSEGNYGGSTWLYAQAMRKTSTEANIYFTQTVASA